MPSRNGRPRTRGRSVSDQRLLTAESTGSSFFSHSPGESAEYDAARETPADFDRYVAEHDIPEEEWPEAFAHWRAEGTGDPVPRFEKVTPGDEEILEEREQRELDGVASFLAIRAEEDAGAEPDDA